MRRLPAILCAIFGCAALAAGAPEASLPPTVLLVSEDAATLAGFYERVLELQVLERDPRGGRILLDAAGTRLLLVDRGGAGRGESPEASGDAPRILLPARDVGAAAARLRALGVSFREVTDGSGATTALFFSDPEGNPLGYLRETAPISFWGEASLREMARERERGKGLVGFAVYGGLFGTWLGIALPVGLGSGEPETIGLAMIAGAPIGAAAAWHYAKRSGVTEGQAGLVSLAGTFATFQGIGWAQGRTGDDDGEILAGALAGTGALVLTAAIAPRFDISPGRVSLMQSGMSWGAWYGLAAGQIAGRYGEQLLEPTLVGSAAGLALTAAWSAGHDISPRRARLVTLGGILGLATGFGLDLIAQPDDDRITFAIPAATSLAGLGIAAHRTRERRGS